ncbi:Ubp3 associated protein Bre5 [compost metagenome]
MINKTQQPHRYAVSLVEPGPFVLQGAEELQLAPGEIVDVAVSVALTAERAPDSATPLRFAVEDLDQPEVRVTAKSTFVSPLNR